jgi:hypothetical protein
MSFAHPLASSVLWGDALKSRSGMQSMQRALIRQILAPVGRSPDQNPTGPCHPKELPSSAYDTGYHNQSGFHALRQSRASRAVLRS